MFSAVLLHGSCCSGKTGHLPKVMQLCNFMVIIKHFRAKHHSSLHTYYWVFFNLAISLDLPLAGLFSRNVLIWDIPNTPHLSRVLVNKSEAERWLDRNPSWIKQLDKPGHCPGALGLQGLQQSYCMSTPLCQIHEYCPWQSLEDSMLSPHFKSSSFEMDPVLLFFLKKVIKVFKAVKTLQIWAQPTQRSW